MYCCLDTFDNHVIIYYDINCAVLLPLRFFLMRSEDPTLIAMGRWMKTNPVGIHSITAFMASTTASSLMSPFSISQGAPCSDLNVFYS